MNRKNVKSPLTKFAAWSTGHYKTEDFCTNEEGFWTNWSLVLILTINLLVILVEHIWQILPALIMLIKYYAFRKFWIFKQSYLNLICVIFSIKI